jgi:hypothetical protein
MHLKENTATKYSTSVRKLHMVLNLSPPEAWLAALLAACTFEMWWFTTSLPVHLTKMLRSLGWRKNDASFWPEALDYKYWMRFQWEEWMVASRSIPEVVRDGLSCPGCFSFHMSYMSGFLASWLVSFDTVGRIVFILLASMTLPYLVVMSLEKLRLVRRSELPRKKDEA